MSSAGCNRYTEKLEESRNDVLLATSPTNDCLTVNSALWNKMMNAALRTFQGGERHVRPFETIYISVVCVLDDLTTPAGPGIIGPGSICAG